MIEQGNGNWIVRVGVCGVCACFFEACWMDRCRVFGCVWFFDVDVV